VGVVGRLARRAHAVTFYSHGENHRGFAAVFHRLGIGRVDLVGIVTAAVEILDILVAHILDQFGGIGVLTEEVLASVGAAVVLAVLQLAVADLVHDLLQVAGFVAFQQRVPHAAPHHLDHVPASAAEHAFQFLDNLAVAAHRAV